MEFLSQAEFELLAAAIKKSAGKVILVISPDEPAIGERFDSVYKNTLMQSKTPVIILESERHIGSLRQELVTMGVHSPFILPTGETNPFLFRAGHSSIHDTGQKDLALLLNKLGATTIMLGGTHSINYASEIGYPREELRADLGRILQNEKRLHGAVGLHDADPMEMITHGCVIREMKKSVQVLFLNGMQVL